MPTVTQWDAIARITLYRQDILQGTYRDMSDYGELFYEENLQNSDSKLNLPRILVQNVR